MSYIYIVVVAVGFSSAASHSSSLEDITLVHGHQTKKFKWKEPYPYPEFLNQDVTVLTTKTLPSLRFMPTIGNGHLATVVHSDTIYGNAIFNGYMGDSHRARIPSTCSIGIKSSSPVLSETLYSLDVGKGIYMEKHTSQDIAVDLKMYAHRKLNRLLVTEITLVNNGTVPLLVNLSQNTGPSSDDISFNVTNHSDFRIYEGYQKQAEYNNSKLVYTYVKATNVPESLTVPPGEGSRCLFLTSIDYSKQGAEDYFKQGVNHFLNDTLETIHVQGWEDIWRTGRIDMAGNLTISQINYAALYYILSSIPDFETGETFVGLSPGDLAHGAKGKDYQGHVFWDQETWMYPPILFLHADKGKELVQTRTRTHESSKDYAKQRGYKGVMFTWESAYTGQDVCPAWPYSDYEQHITGDVAYAIKQYIMMTQDTDFLEREGGIELINDIASFWASRVIYNNKTGLYDINDVMPPDEYNYPVNNSVYTNVVAAIALRLPTYAMSLINRQPNTEFENIADQLNIPFNDSGKWHPEYDTYEYGQKVKQADTILLGFPLNAVDTPEVRRNDLEAYDEVTDTEGPAMTWGMFTVAWLELGKLDKAMEKFNTQFLNVVPPFNMWSEQRNARGAVNFITGMGGYLQSIIFGFGGFRIFQDRLDFDPTLPRGIDTLNITGVDYLGGSLDFQFTATTSTVTQTKRAKRNLKVNVSSGEEKRLEVGEVFRFASQKAASLIFYDADRPTSPTDKTTPKHAHSSATTPGAWHQNTYFIYIACIFVVLLKV